MANGISPLAKQIQGRKTAITTRKPWGLLFHTTGGGITPKAKKTGKKPVDVAIQCYLDSQNGSNGYPWGGPTYVMDHDGTLYQLADESTKTNHAGGDDREKYLDGTWINHCSKPAVAYWHAHWAPKFSNPQQLYPSKSANTDYIGVEMIPCGDGFGQPMAPGLRFTKAQHDAAIRLALDVGKRNGFPAGWERTSRLVGHEDVQPIERHDKLGGWDPGWLREKPYFDFNYLRAGVESALKPKARRPLVAKKAKKTKKATSRTRRG